MELVDQVLERNNNNVVRMCNIKNGMQKNIQRNKLNRLEYDKMEIIQMKLEFFEQIK